MAKKYFNWPIVGALLAGMILMANYNAIAYKDDEGASDFVTDKSDRTLIKEIYANQGEMLSILRDIQSRMK